MATKRPARSDKAGALREKIIAAHIAEWVRDRLAGALRGELRQLAREVGCKHPSLLNYVSGDVKRVTRPMQARFARCIFKEKKELQGRAAQLSALQEGADTWWYKEGGKELTAAHRILRGIVIAGEGEGVDNDFLKEFGLQPVNVDEGATALLARMNAEYAEWRGRQASAAILLSHNASKAQVWPTTTKRTPPKPSPSQPPP